MTARIELGDIAVIEEQISGYQPRYAHINRTASSSRNESTPIEPGNQTVRVSIHAVWKLK